ncbi:hypothetical protein [Sphingomonas sp.]|uniref:hypothetical protein n=1 Tax=Sphingomonas sp. TaxID=28214 RepID=UPI00286B2F50|nr:hypothetical protein [Sphingomonas sp.]
MAILPPVSSPRAALRDFFAVFRHGDNRDRVLGLTLAVLITVIIIIIFFVDSTVNTAPPQQITYVQDYKPGRTDAEIIADQKKDQAEREAFAKAKQEQFKKLEKRLGIE